MNEYSIQEIRSKLDNEVKKLLAQKIFLARILQRVAPEFSGMNDEETMACIEGEPKVGTEPVDPMTTEIKGMSNEDTSPGEGTIRYDIIFEVCVPRENENILMIINVEAQGNHYPGYSLVTRGIYYAARKISSQKHTVFEKSDYKKIRKVYSIWISMNAPEKQANAISTYSIQKKDLIPGIISKPEDYDKLCVVLITLREGKESTDPFLQMMNMLLSDKISKNEKLKKLESEYHIPSDHDVEKGVGNMCNYSEMIAMKNLEYGKKEGIREGKKEGIREGKKEGIREGIIGAIRALSALNHSPEEILGAISQQFALSMEDAEKYVKQTLF